MDRPFPLYRVIITGLFLLVLFVIATLGSTAPASEGAEESKFSGILDPDLRNKLEHYTQAMAATRPLIEVETADGRYKTDSCAGFMALSGHDGRARALNSHPLASAYRDCAVLRVLHTAREPEQHLSTLAGLGQAVFTRLDPASLQSLAPAWAVKAARLAGIGSDHVEIGDRRVILARGQSTWTMEVIASVDVAGPPVEDLVVRVSRDGVAAGFLVLVSRTDGSLNALPLDVFIMGGGVAMAQATPP
ncbi:hypothetical protein N825_03370 [Skermanella stibiiresistens SB22]|uniref:Uncharacterized protein n=2 Tax=Skermanella TaxID=204447 RepID=W9H626_9PROT|nr:hypothetical protein N825_03370 [Skermanella stibiiresistens SB22]